MTIHDIVDFVLRSFEASAPVVVYLTWQHSRRNDAPDKRFNEVHSTLRTIDTDISGLTQQLGAMALETERRFITKTDHAEAIHSLNKTMDALNQNVTTLNDRLYAAMCGRHTSSSCRRQRCDPGGGRRIGFRQNHR